jgi:hypothetical protein
MIIPSQHASRVARAAAGGGGGGGVTPNAVNWADVTGANFQLATTAMLQITGITSTITLRVTYTGAGDNRQYSVQSTANFGTGTAIASNGTFTVSNNQYLGFGSGNSGPSLYKATTWTITNVSDGDAVLDTVTTTAYAEEE